MDERAQAERARRQTLLARITRPANEQPSPPAYDRVVRGLRDADLAEELLAIAGETRTYADGYIEAVREEAQKRGLA